MRPSNRLRGRVRQSDVAIQAGRDDSAADRLNDVFVQCLQIFQRAAGVFQPDVHLAQFCRQQSRQIGYREIGEKIDQDDGLQRAAVRDGVVEYDGMTSK